MYIIKKYLIKKLKKLYLKIGFAWWDIPPFEEMTLKDLLINLRYTRKNTEEIKQYYLNNNF